MADGQKQELNTFNNSEVVSAIMDKPTILTQKIGKIAERWSRNLYQTALRHFKE